MTSIELLFNKLWEEPKDKLTWNSILEEAKEMHKQEIIDAYEQGSDDEIVAYIGTRNYKHGLEYYTYTYGSKGSDKNKQ